MTRKYLVHTFKSYLHNNKPFNAPTQAAVYIFRDITLYAEPVSIARTSDGVNGNHSVLLPISLIKIKVDQMLPSSYISSLLVPILCL